MRLTIKEILSVFLYVYSYAFSFAVINKSNGFPDLNRPYGKNRKSLDFILFGDGINDFIVFAVLLSLRLNTSAGINVVVMIITAVILTGYSVYYYSKTAKVIKRYKEYVQTLDTNEPKRPVYYHAYVFKIVLKILISAVICTITDFRL